MARHEFQISEESRPLLEYYIALPRRDLRRIELFSFLAEAVENPNGVAFEQDDDGLRWTWLEHVALVWKLDLIDAELDVVDVRDEQG